MAMVGRSQAQVMHHWTMGPEAQEVTGELQEVPHKSGGLKTMTHAFVCFIGFPKNSARYVFFLKCLECFKTTLKYGGRL